MIKGVLWRMAARGHKRAHSQQGSQIVQTGPYALVRNPMYLGSFLIGAGFVVIAWPWWSLPIFVLFFYIRFNQQIVAEEKYLTDAFPEEFATYSRKTPRLFPSFQGVDKLKSKEVIDLREALSTKEVHGLWAWPLLAVILELLQECLVFGILNLAGILTIFVAAIGALIIGLWIMSRL